MKVNPFSALRRMSTEAAIFAALSLLFALLAVLQALAWNLIDALQFQIFSLLFLQLYHFEITKSMVKKVSRK